MRTPGEQIDQGMIVPGSQDELVLYASLPLETRNRLLYGAGDPISHKLVAERLGTNDLTYISNVGWVASSSLLEDPPEQLSFELSEQ